MPLKPKTRKTPTSSAKDNKATIKPLPKSKPPQWPQFSPLPDPSTLTLTTLLPDQILTIPHLWSSSPCAQYIAFLRTLPLVTTPATPQRGAAVRVNDRFQVHDPGFARTLWEGTALRSLVCGGDDDGGDARALTELWGGKPLGLIPNVRVYRYGAGQFFDRHYDDSNNVSFPTTNDAGEVANVPAVTTWTLLLYLSGAATGCEGGETVFYPEATTATTKKGRGGGKVEVASEPVVVEPEIGLALLHRHGRRCMLHEGREVRKGEKWVIRSDLCVAR